MEPHQTPSQRSYASAREGYPHSDISSTGRKGSGSSDAAYYSNAERSSRSSQTGEPLRLSTNFQEDLLQLRELERRYYENQNDAGVCIALAEAIKVYTQYEEDNDKISSRVIEDLEKHSESLSSLSSVVEFIEDMDVVTQFVTKYDTAVRQETEVSNPFTDKDSIVVQQIAPLTFLQWQGQYYSAFGNREAAQTAFKEHKRITAEIKAWKENFVRNYIVHSE